MTKHCPALLSIQTDYKRRGEGGLWNKKAAVQGLFCHLLEDKFGLASNCSAVHLQNWNDNNQPYRVISENENRSYVWNCSVNIKTLYKSLNYHFMITYSPFLLVSYTNNMNFWMKSGCQAQPVKKLWSKSDRIIGLVW